MTDRAGRLRGLADILETRWTTQCAADDSARPAFDVTIPTRELDAVIQALRESAADLTAAEAERDTARMHASRQSAVQILRDNAAYCAARAEGAERGRWLAHVAAYDEVLLLGARAVEDGPLVPEA